MMLKISDLLSHRLLLLVIVLISIRTRLIRIDIQKHLSYSVKVSPHISVIFFVISISSIIACPVQSTVVIPNRHYIFNPSSHWLDLLPKHLTHKRHKILSRVAINRSNSITLLHRKLLHHTFHNSVRILIKFLKIMTKISHYMSTLQYPF